MGKKNNDQKCDKCNKQCNVLYADKSYDGSVEFYCEDCFIEKYGIDPDYYVKEYLEERGIIDEE